MTPKHQMVLYETVLEGAAATGRGLTEIRGRAVPYGVLTNRGIFLESVRSGCFDKSIGEAGPVASPSTCSTTPDRFPIGRVDQVGNRKRDALYGVWRLDKGPEAQRAAELAAEGLLRYMSVGHAPIRSEWELVDTEEWNPDLGPDHMDRLTRVESRWRRCPSSRCPPIPRPRC